MKTSSKHIKPSNSTKPQKLDKFLGILAIVFFSTFVLSAATVCGIIVWLSVLPLKYLLALVAATAIIAIVLGFFTFKKFAKPRSTHLARIICAIVSFILTGLFCVAFFYLEHTIGFMNDLRPAEYQIDEYQVLVKNDSAFADLADLDGHAIAIYDAGEENYQTALEELRAKITIEPVDYGSSTNAATALLNGAADALFIKSSLATALSDVMSNFKLDDLRVLDTIEIRTEIDTVASDINVAKDSFNIFISGIDTRGDISTVARSDVNMFVTVNPRTHTILLTSIPRDYYVQLHGTTGLKDKLTHAGLYGIDMSINTLQDLFGVKIDYYVRVNFDSTIQLIDAIEGIDITPDATFYSKVDNACYFEDGVTKHYYGRCALAYARERKVYGTGDLHRIQNQQEVIMAVINKLTGSKVLLAKYTDILSSMSGTLETNLPPSQIYKLVNEQLDSMPSWHIERIAAEGDHIDAPTYTFGNQLLYVFVPREESVAAVALKIQEVMDAN